MELCYGLMYIYMRNMSTIMFMYYDEPMLWGAGKQVEVRVEAQERASAAAMSRGALQWQKSCAAAQIATQHSKTLARDKLRGREALPKPSHVPSAAKIRLRSHYSYL